MEETKRRYTVKMCYSGTCPQEIYDGPKRGECSGPVNGHYNCEQEQEGDDDE